MPRTRRSLIALAVAAGAAALVALPAASATALEWDPDNPTEVAVDAFQVTVSGSCDPAHPLYDDFDRIYISFGTVDGPIDGGPASIDGPHSGWFPYDPVAGPGFTVSLNLDVLTIPPEAGNHLAVQAYCDAFTTELPDDIQPDWLDLVFVAADEEPVEPEDPEEPGDEEPVEHEQPADPDDPDAPTLAETGLPAETVLGVLGAAGGALLLGAAAIVADRRRRARGA